MSLRSEIVRILNELLAGSKKITDLTDADPLTGLEYVEVVQDGVNKKVAAANLSGGSFDLSGVVQHRGNFSLASNLFPSTGGTGSAGAVEENNRWLITDGSTTLLDENGETIPAGVFIEAKVDNPSTTDISDWWIIQEGALDSNLSTKKDATGGIVGLTLFKINFKNALNTFTSFFTNANTAARTYTFQDKDGTIADLSDVIGLQDISIPASAMWPRETGPCDDLVRTQIATSLLNIQTLDFSASVQQYAQFIFSLPRNWDRGTITAKFLWTAASGSGDVIWSIAAVAYSDNDAMTTVFGTAQTVTDTLGTADTVRITSATSAVTVGNTPADGDMIAFEVSRVAADGGDTLGVKAKLLGVIITVTTDSAVAS